jgi:hypothetical protein
LDLLKVNRTPADALMVVDEKKEVKREDARICKIELFGIV